jgi:transglutaminase-like putative cysteine protease
VVTGITCSLLERAKYLHSWVETKNEDGQEFCLDVTNNIMMPKEDFYYLFKVKPCSEVTRKQYIEDAPRLKSIWGFGVKQYLLNREDALKVADRLAKDQSTQSEE